MEHGKKLFFTHQFAKLVVAAMLLLLRRKTCGINPLGFAGMGDQLTIFINEIASASVGFAIEAIEQKGYLPAGTLPS
ncbi:MAG: hypothetical protein R2877_01140 [Bdellovibrionota bacterium]